MTKVSWLERLRTGLSKSSSKIADGITVILSSRGLDDAALDEIEDLLITADMGTAMATRLVDGLRRQRFAGDDIKIEVLEALADDIEKILKPITTPLISRTECNPQVIVMAGVNGTGKTTTIGKLAKQFTNQGHSVMLAACDTFRAAAVEQLCIWGERARVPVITAGQGADPAGLAYNALKEAREKQTDILLIDTAGRLQNKQGLMAELQKVIRVLGKQYPGAPHDCILVLDATTGQNAHSQVEIFRDMVSVTGLIVTKLDGAARGGVLVALAERFRLPIHAVGIGEGIEDLQTFSPRDFARSLLQLAN